MKSIIFFDIDGTLVSDYDSSIIPESTIRAIQETRKKGNITVVNSGRTAFNINKNVKDLGFDGYICGCGTYIEYNGEILLYNKLKQDFCRKIAEINRRLNVTPVYEWKDGYFFDDKAIKSQMLDNFLVNFVDEGIDTSKRVEDSDFIFDKFVVWGNENSDMDGFINEIGKYFSIIDRGNSFYEIVPLGFTKATAIKFLTQMLGISMERAYAIGDSPNDLPMFEAVTNSIAMGGAEKIYPYVSYITSPLMEDGIYNALKHFELI